MCLHLDSGTVTYSSADEAAVDLRKWGFTVGPIPVRRSKDITMETINILGKRQTGNAHDYQENICEKRLGDYSLGA